jgi:hypothetical protein
MEITNRTLVMLFLVTLAITIFGTLTSLSRISGLESLTGAWESGSTTRGSVNLTIQSSVNINFTQDRANFGSGYVDMNVSACYLETSKANFGCVSFTDGASVKPLLLENQGNANVRLNLSNTNTSTSLIGGTNPGYAWMWETPETTSNANLTCARESPANSTLTNNTFANITTALTSLSMLCSMFNATDTADVINISFKLLIPNNAPARSGLSDTWTAVAVAI